MYKYVPPTDLCMHLTSVKYFCKKLTTCLLLVLFRNTVGKSLSEPSSVRIIVGNLDIVRGLNRTQANYVQLQHDKPP